MKRISMLLLCAFITFNAMAQEVLVLKSYKVQVGYRDSSSKIVFNDAITDVLVFSIGPEVIKVNDAGKSTFFLTSPYEPSKGVTSEGDSYTMSFVEAISGKQHDMRISIIHYKSGEYAIGVSNLTTDSHRKYWCNRLGQ